MSRLSSLLALCAALLPRAARGATAAFTVAGLSLLRVGDNTATFSSGNSAPLFIEDFDAQSFATPGACFPSTYSTVTVSTASCVAGGPTGITAATGVAAATGNVWTATWLFPVRRATTAYLPCIQTRNSFGGGTTTGLALSGGGGVTVTFGVATTDIAGTLGYTCTGVPTGANDFSVGPLRGVETDGTSLWMSGAPAVTKPGFFKYPLGNACGGSTGTRVAPGMPASLFQMRVRPATAPAPWPALFTAAAGTNVTYGVRTPLWLANAPNGDGIRAFDFAWTTSGWPAACTSSTSGLTIAAFDWAVPSTTVPAPAWAVATLWFGELSGCLGAGVNLARVYCDANYRCPFDANTTAWAAVGPAGSAVTGVVVLPAGASVWVTVASASSSALYQIVERAAPPNALSAVLARTAMARSEYRSLYATPDLGANTAKAAASCAPSPSASPSVSPRSATPTSSSSPSSTVTSSGTPSPSFVPPLAAPDPSLNVGGSGLSAGALGGIVGGILVLGAALGVGAHFTERKKREKARLARRANVASRTRGATDLYGVHESRSRKELEGPGAVKVMVVTSGGDEAPSRGRRGGGGGANSLTGIFGRRAAPEVYVDPYDAAARAARGEPEAYGEDEGGFDGRDEPDRPDPLAGLSRPKLVRSLTAKAEPAPARPSRSASARGGSGSGASTSSLTSKASPAPARPSRGASSLTAKAEPASRGGSVPARPSRR